MIKGNNKKYLIINDKNDSKKRYIEFKYKKLQQMIIFVIFSKNVLHSFCFINYNSKRNLKLEILK